MIQVDADNHGKDSNNQVEADNRDKDSNDSGGG